MRVQTMQNRQQNLGDTPPEEFRKQLHELADWIADFRQNLEALKVAPNEKPGAILAALPAKGPETSEPFETILGDINRLVVPGMVLFCQAEDGIRFVAVTGVQTCALPISCSTVDMREGTKAFLEKRPAQFKGQ